MIAPDVAAVVALEPYLIRIVFADGEVRDVDIEPLLDGAIFAPLREHMQLELVYVHEETGAVAWPNGADLDSDVVCGVATASRQPAARVTTPQVA